MKTSRFSEEQIIAVPRGDRRPFGVGGRLICLFQLLDLNPQLIIRRNAATCRTSHPSVCRLRALLRPFTRILR